MLKRLVKEEKINLVIGTSMGGMFAQKLQGTYKILVNKIRYFESDKRQVNLYSTDGVSSFYKKLDEVEAQLEQMNIKFLRISKSYLVNVNYVKEFRYEKVVMDDGKEFKIGPRYKDKIRKSYIELMRIS